MKEATWRKKQIQTILSATHTVTAKLQEGKTKGLELMRFCLDLWRKRYRLYYEGRVDACGPNSNALSYAE